ncbi:MAG: 6-phospho-3-hexuloisomerase, partial [Deltaproteobacteria bacterium]|nr:6-phospho-3-hexuloisomerase [Deltaproteobacteria bacterium]
MTLNIRKTIDGIMEENRRLAESLNDEAAAEFIQNINNARSIFFSAQGRSGFILRAFCMRLMHLGYRVYFCGETITPAIGRD